MLGVLEQAGQLAAAEHGGLIDHQHGAGVQLLPSVMQSGVRTAETLGGWP
jgi:hypothetical protein